MTGEIQFEKAMERLEKIVEELERGEITLDEALKKYEEGVKLSRACQEKLSQAEKRIEVLLRSKDGSFKKEKFEESDVLDDAKSESKSKKSAKAAKKSEEDDDGDLLL